MPSACAVSKMNMSVRIARELWEGRKKEVVGILPLYVKKIRSNKLRHTGERIFRDDSHWVPPAPP